MEAVQTTPTTFSPPPESADAGASVVRVPGPAPERFANFFIHSQPNPQVKRRRRAAIGVAVVVHLFGLGYAVYGDLMRVDELAAPAVTLSLLTMPTIDKVALAPAPAAAVKRPRPATAPKPVAAPVPVLEQPVVAETVTQPEAPAPDVVAEAEGEASEGGGSPTGDAAEGGNGTVGTANGSASGTGNVVVPERAIAPPVLDEQTRRAWLAKYLREHLRKRIDDNRFYPPEAEEEGLEAIIVLRLAIDKNGRVISVSVVRGDHVPVLARAALATLQKAQPFAPPPKELGERISLDVSIDYKIAL